MELYQEILARILSGREAKVSFADLHIDAEKIVEMACYRALQNIKAIIEDDSLNDKECFMKIEEIVCVFEEMGSSGGSGTILDEKAPTERAALFCALRA